MGLKQLKVLTGIFGTAVAGIVFCFGMSIYTAVQHHRAAEQATPISIPTPALGS